MTQAGGSGTGYNAPSPPGPPGAGGWQPQTVVYRPTNGLAIAALILAFVFAPAGLVMGIIAKGQCKQSAEDGEGLATAAIVVSAIVLLLWVTAIVTFVAILLSVSSGTSFNVNTNTGATSGAILGVW